MSDQPTPTQVLDWEARYREGRTGWERGALNPALQGFLADGTLSPGRILVPGAGRSPEPLALARLGFHVVAIDISPSAVAAQQALLAGVGGAAVMADLFTWQPDLPLDAVYDQACLCALPPALLPAYAARLAEWVRPGGVLAALFMQTGRDGGPPFHCGLDHMRLLFPDDLWAWPDLMHPSVAHAIGTEIPAALRRR